MIRPLIGNLIFAGSTTVFPLLSYLLNLKALGYSEYINIIYGQIIFEIFMVLIVRALDIRFIRIISRGAKISNVQYLIGLRIATVLILSSIALTFIHIGNFNDVLYLYIISGIFTIFNMEAIYQALGAQMKLAKIKLIQLSLFLFLSFINLYLESIIFVGLAFLLTNIVYVFSTHDQLKKMNYNAPIFEPKLTRLLYYKRAAMILINKITWLLNARAIYVILGVYSNPAFMVLYDFYYKCYGTLTTLVGVINNTFLKDIFRKHLRKEFVLIFGLMTIIVAAILIYFLVNNVVVKFIDIPRDAHPSSLNYVILLNMCIVSFSSLIGVVYLISSSGSKIFYMSTYLMILVQTALFSVLFMLDHLSGIFLLAPITFSLALELLYRIHHARKTVLQDKKSRIFNSF